MFSNLKTAYLYLSPLNIYKGSQQSKECDHHISSL